MKDDIELEPGNGEALELDLPEPGDPRVPQRPAAITRSLRPTLSVTPPRQGYPSGSLPDRPRAGRGIRALVAAGSLVVGLLLLGAFVLVVRPPLLGFETQAEQRFELKHWTREYQPRTGDHYGYLLEAPDSVQRKLSCDRLRRDGTVSWTCTCSEAGNVTRTAKTGELEPKTAVALAQRARELCGWPFWAECPKEEWLACMIMDR